MLVLTAAGVLVAGAVGIEVASSGSSGSSGAVPWLPTKPSIGPANPPLAPACTASQLSAQVSNGAGAGMDLGGITLVDRSSRPCSLTGRPDLSLRGWRITTAARGSTVVSAYSDDPLAPPLGSLRALRPGEHVLVGFTVLHYCEQFPASTVKATEQPLVLTAPGGGKVDLGGESFLSCKVGSTSPAIPVSRYTPFVPNRGPSTRLPLRARIVSTGTPLLNGYGKPLPDATLAARAGRWVSFTVVLTNTSRHAFRFGRRCPAYTESIKPPYQAFVLNCHAIGAIAPRGSVRFAMRAFVPRNTPSPYALGWTLAPHTYNAPEAGAILQLH